MTVKPTRRRWRGPLLTALFVAMLAALAFKLFEPVLVYRSGWAAVPAGAYPVQQEALDPALAAQAQVAQAALEKARARMDAPAISAAVSIDGKLVWRSAAGFADLETRRPVQLTSRFRLGSTSKAVTSIAVGTLLDAGKLDLDAPIQTYVPRFPAQKWPISLRQVMSHRAGIRDYGACLCFPIWEHESRKRFPDVDAEVDLVARSPLLFQPGTRFAYTSLGYNLAGAAVEHAGGMPFGQYLDRKVFGPLAMTQSGLDAVPGAERDRVSFYEIEGGRFKPAWPVDNSIRWPSGGVLSTPSDMVKLGEAMLDDRLLSEKTRQTLTTVQGGRGVYALGWRNGTWTLYDGKLKTTAWHHAGTAVGSTSVFVVFPQYRMVISVMMNKGGTNVDDLAAATDQIAQAFIRKP